MLGTTSADAHLELLGDLVGLEGVVEGRDTEVELLRQPDDLPCPPTNMSATVNDHVGNNVCIQYWILSTPYHLHIVHLVTVHVELHLASQQAHQPL